MDQVNEILSVANQKEKILWKDKPSHIYMFSGYMMAFGLLIALAVIIVMFNLPAYFLAVPFLLIIWCYLVVVCSSYELTTQRLKYTYGVLNQSVDQMELYRVKDYRLERPLILRLFGLSNIILDTSDKSCPIFRVYGIKNADAVIESVRKNVERRREERFIRELDVN